MESFEYGYERILETLDFEQAIEKVTRSLKEEGFGVITEIDVAATLKEKIGVDFRPYRILGACNPKLAHGAIEMDPRIGLLLPCNVVVQQTDEGRVSVSVGSPVAMFAVVGDTDLTHLAAHVEEKVRKALSNM